jgi:hypothetical protein
MQLRCLGIALGLGLLGGMPVQAAPPKPKAAPLPSVTADVLPAGQFAGTLLSLPGSDRMFTLKITYPEVRLKPGAKMPNLQSQHSRVMHQMYQQMSRAQRIPHHRGGGYHHHYNAMTAMMQQQQMFMQGEARMAQAVARAQQQELRLLQQEIKAILNMYQVVQVSRDVDFQADEKLKVRINYLPEQFDDKGNIKQYTAAEKAELKGKDKKLMGYESSPDAMQVGQTVVVALRTHKKPKPAAKLATAAAGKDANPDKDADKKDADKDSVSDSSDKDRDESSQHRMQVMLIVILKESTTPQNSSNAPAKKKKK